jgi:hypothetical protein
MLYKRWRTLTNIKTVWKSSEPNWPTDSALEETWTSADACQKGFANHLMLLRVETLLVVNDKEKWERRFPKMSVEELNRVNSRLTPRNVKEMLVKAGGYVYAC